MSFLGINLIKLRWKLTLGNIWLSETYEGSVDIFSEETTGTKCMTKVTSGFRHIVGRIKHACSNSWNC